ncbi:MAG: tRNA1(Val) (adenine(37)-N6)-methyltransferase [Hyphomicrobiaceae bacterium]
MTIEARENVSEGVATTDDAFLGGKLQLLQPADGYRAGLDALLLAASVPTPLNIARVLDVGSGVGTVGLCAAQRESKLDVTLVERDETFVQLACQNIERNNLSARCRVVRADVVASPAQLSAIGLTNDTFDHVLANPPFHEVGRGTLAPNQLKEVAHAMDGQELETWARFIVRVTKPRGLTTFIHKAQELPRLLAVLSGRFGGLTVLPIISHPGGVAHRVLVRGQKGSRAPFQLLSPFIVHSQQSSPLETSKDRAKLTDAAESILRHGARLEAMQRSH